MHAGSVNGSFENKLKKCRETFSVRYLDHKSSDFLVNLYDFSRVQFSEGDFASPDMKRLEINYGKQLLIPLFQKSALYGKLNRMLNNKPRYNPHAASQEVEDYMGGSGSLQGRIFLLLESPSDTLFQELVGYAIGYRIDTSEIKHIFETKFTPSSIGTYKSDTFQMDISMEKLKTYGPLAYYDGLGIARKYQGHFLGMFMTYRFFVSCRQQGYKYSIVRVIRKAKNWSFYAGNEDKRETAIGDTKIIAKYFNPAINDKTFYRAIFLTNVDKAIADLRTILKISISIKNERDWCQLKD